MEFSGWDTHANQGLAGGALDRLLGQLAEGLVAFRTDMGTAWPNTTVVVMTEFGRTARPNGTRGTDHGTAGAGFVLGPRLREVVGRRRLAGAGDERAVRRARPQADARHARGAQGRDRRRVRSHRGAARPRVPELVVGAWDIRVDGVDRGIGDLGSGICGSGVRPVIKGSCGSGSRDEGPTHLDRLIPDPRSKTQIDPI